MEQKTQKIGLINLLALLLVGTAGYAVARYGNTLAGMTGAVFMGVGTLVAGISWFQARLEERERLEKLEFEELTKSAASSALFNASETEVFPAQRSRNNSSAFSCRPSRSCYSCSKVVVPFCSGAGFRKPFPPRLQNPSSPALCLVCSPCCCFCSANIPPAWPGWNASACCGRERAICCSAPILAPSSRQALSP